MQLPPTMARPQQTLSLAPPRQTVVVAGPDRRGSYLCLRRLLVFLVVNICVSHPPAFVIAVVLIYLLTTIKKKEVCSDLGKSTTRSEQAVKVRERADDRLRGCLRLAQL